jgi:hypothetical protein
MKNCPVKVIMVTAIFTVADIAVGKDLYANRI